MGLKPIMACSDPIPARFNYIPDVEAVVGSVNSSFDLAISLDCSDLERLGDFPQMPAFGSAPLLNIDHHLTNLDFGTVNLVDPQASSTAEIVLRLLEYMAVPLDAKLATCLLIGIVADTRGFRTNNVTIQIMEAALRLMMAGALLPYVTQHSLDRRSITAILLWRAALALLQIEDRVIWTSIPLVMRRAVGHTGNGEGGRAAGARRYRCPDRHLKLIPPAPASGRGSGRFLGRTTWFLRLARAYDDRLGWIPGFQPGGGEGARSGKGRLDLSR